MIRHHNLIIGLTAVGLLVGLLVRQPLNLCKSKPVVSYDTQNVLSWEYMATKGAIPYRDYKTMYGLLNHYKTTNAWAYGLGIMLVPIIYGGLWWVFYNTYPQVFVWVSLAAAILVIEGLLGYRSFGRYGLVPLMGVISAWIAFRPFRGGRYLGLGVGTGLIISGMTDIGLLVLVVTVVTAWLVAGLIKRKTNQFKTKELIKAGAFFVLGLFTGVLPLGWWLTHTGAVKQFFMIVSSSAGLAKTGKLLYSLTGDRYQIPVIILLMVGLISLVWGYRHWEKRSGQAWMVLAGLWVASGLLFQKNLIRPQYDVMAMASVLLLIGLIGYGVIRGQKRYPWSIWLGVGLMMAATAYLSSGLRTTNLIRSPGLGKLTTFWPDRLCHRADFSLEKMPLASEQVALVTQMKQKYPGAKLVSYPYEPILSSLFDTLPLPTLDSYNAADIDSQSFNINYLNQNRIEYIVYNVSHGMIDNVPDYVRAPKMLMYMLTHYRIIDQIGTYYVWQRQSGKLTEFEPMTLVPYPDLNDYLSNLELGQLPRLEAQKLTKLKEVDKELVLTVNQAQGLNDFIKRQPTESEGVFLLVAPVEETSRDQVTEIVIQADSGGKSRLMMRQCSQNGCLVNLKNLPGLAGNARMQTVATAANFNGRLELWRINEDGLFW